MAGITLTIDVDDKGTVKVKQFADESKKAFKEMTDGPKQAQGPLDTLKESWIGITAKVAIATAAFYAAKRMIYDTAKEIASATNEIEKQSKLVGMSTDEWQKWQYAAKMSDVNAQELGIGIKMLSMNMEAAATGTGDANKYFSAMGVSVKTTEGHLRPLNQVMGDIMDKFASWEDGPRKIAISMQLFGRSGEALIPLLNKGRAGFNEFAEEARKLGIIFSPELVRKGSEAGDIFKRLEERSKATRLSFAPLVLESAKMVDGLLENFNRLDKWLKENKTENWFPWLKDIKQWMKDNSLDNWLSKLGIFTERYKKTQDIQAWEPGPTPIPKGKPPEVIGFLTKEEIEKDVLAFRQLVAEAERLSDLGKMPSWLDSIEQIAHPVLRDITELDLNLNKIIGDANRLRELGEMPSWLDSIEQIPKRALPDIIQLELELNKLIAEAEKLRAEGKMPSWLDALETQMGVGQADWRVKITGMQQMWEGVAQNISSAWSSNMVNIIRSTGSTTEKVKSFFQSIGDVFLSTVSKMITQWLLLGSITGEKGGWGSKGGGWGGILGSVISLFAKKEGGILPGPWKPIHAFQSGGMVDRPTLGMIGEGGPEAVVPLKGGKIPIEMQGKQGKGDTYVYFVNPIGFDQALMKNMGTILKGVAKDARMAGPMHSIMKGSTP